MSEIANKIQEFRTQIRVAEQQFGRQSGSVKMLAVSKGQTIAAIRDAILAGQFAFGENYLQEALPKIKALANYPVEWHFIGHLQANKTRSIAENFSWLHSLWDIAIAKRLQIQRPVGLPPLNVFIQVNVKGDSQRYGVHLTELLAFVQEIQRLPQLKLRGLMLLPIDQQHPEQEFAALSEALAELAAQGIHLTELSMGMSHDFIAAIAAGSTWVRIGQGIFGARQRRSE